MGVTEIAEDPEKDAADWRRGEEPFLWENPYFLTLTFGKRVTVKLQKTNKATRQNGRTFGHSCCSGWGWGEQGVI